MPEIEGEIIANAKAANLYFSTQQNGDKLVITGLKLSQEQASSLTWLVNSFPDTELEIHIKEKNG